MHNIKKNWDEMARAYEEFTEGENSYSYVIEWTCIKKMLPVLNNKDILELGCGSGRFTFLLEEKEPKSIKGIDISKEMLKMAKEKGKKKNSIINASYLLSTVSLG
ncbi:MAG: class I SAM-dependent methyltransferase [Clostridiaceae bacterium]|nr:class I SAM-dependent methyltransferase [Clostridiaceae bacterium]